MTFVVPSEGPLALNELLMIVFRADYVVEMSHFSVAAKRFETTLPAIIEL